MFGLLPKNLEFFDDFDRAAQNAKKSAELLAAYTRSQDFTNPERVAALIEAEHAGDKITHETLDRLEKTYITPIDRDDIHKLISRIDDVVDSVESVAQRMSCYRISKVRPEFQDQCDVLVKAATVMAAAVNGLRNLKSWKSNKTGDSLEKLVIAVHEAEEEGDAIHHKFLGDLFNSGLDAMEVIKWKELHEIIEQAIDYCDDVACQIHGIALKNM